MPVGRAQAGSAEFAEHLLFLAPSARGHEIGRSSHVETDLALLFANLHFCIVEELFLGTKGILLVRFCKW